MAGSWGVPIDEYPREKRGMLRSDQISQTGEIAGGRIAHGPLDARQQRGAIHGKAQFDQASLAKGPHHTFAGYRIIRP